MLRLPLASKYPAILLPALALTLTACPDDPIETTGDEETEGTTSGTSTTEPDQPTTTNPDNSTSTTLDPSTSTTSPTSSTDPDTTDPSTTSTDPSTTSTDPGTSTTTDTTTDGTTTDGTGTTTDGTGTTGTTTDGTTGTTGEDVFELSSVWVTVNPGGLTSDRVVGLDPALGSQLASITPGGDVASIQSIAITGGGDGIITVDLPVANTGGVILDEDMANNPPPTGAIGVGERFIKGPLTELQTPKGVEADVPGGVFLVADTAAKNIKAFDDDADGDVAPVFKISNIGASPSIWDMHYEESTDSLYAAGTDGVVRVYDNFSTTKGANGPTRSITPFNMNAKASINLHGVAIRNNTLYLSDVGDAMNATDGKLFVINNADMATGNVPVAQLIQNGKLGNPVDIEVVQQPGIGELLVVAEKSNDVLLAYVRPPMMMNYGNPVEFARPKLESVAVITNNLLVLASNPAGLDTDQALVQGLNIMMPPMPSSVLSQLGSVTSVQSVVLDGAGNGLVSFDGAVQSGGGGVFAIPGLSALVGDLPTDATALRLWGPNTDIVAPKGIVLDASDNTLFVADFGAADVKVFDGTSLADSAPLFTLSALGAAPWDVAYDDAADRLFVALVNGTVLVFDDLLTNQGGVAARTIIPTNDMDMKISVNLHGVEYDAANDLLLLSDVGSAMSNSDGQLFLIGAASTADGNVPVQAQVGGNMTKLGNPVDIAYDGVNLYVAEKINSQVLRYDGFAALTGANNVAESAARMVTNPESVSLFFTLVP